ncbi:MAG: 50S ribosomal protein L4 [Candidatus Omnitrophica bacterium]|nr:50S ribosomal protein L4 [Candidatus Omnitrophota bacterium]MDD5238480.1 50S ribosomal protein L4 [Candidatus Omnitrophota bacterium]
MEAITLPIYNTEGKEVDSIKLDAKVFDGSINTAVLYQAITAYRANQRKGMAATKTRGEVSGGGRKPWKQKGTGRARVGSTRSPLWRHGGVTFGPHPRDYSYKLPQKLKAQALKSIINAKVKENDMLILDDLKIDKPKTSAAAKIFSNLKLNNEKKQKIFSVLLLLDKCDNNLKLALRNLKFLDINLAKDTHAYEVMAHRKLVITKNGLTELTDRLSQVKSRKEKK